MYVERHDLDLDHLDEFRGYLERKLYRKIKGLQERKKSSHIKQELQRYRGRQFAQASISLISDY